jgi:hypothetical protein
VLGRIVEPLRDGTFAGLQLSANVTIALPFALHSKGIGSSASKARVHPDLRQSLYDQRITQPTGTRGSRRRPIKFAALAADAVRFHFGFDALLAFHSFQSRPILDILASFTVAHRREAAAGRHS